MRTFSLLLLFILPFLAFAQEENRSLLILEFQYGLNANATTPDEIAQPFLNKAPARNMSFNFGYLYQTKKGKLWEFSAAAGMLAHSFSLSNLQYEFDYSHDDDCCVYFPSYSYLNLGTSYLLKAVDRKKIKTLIGLGVGLNIDIATMDGGFTINNRRYWSYYDNKNGPAIFPNIDLSTRFIYHLTDNFMVTSNLGFQYAPFYELDLTYFINSRDGSFEGLFHQKLLGVNLSLGIGYNIN